MKRLAVAALLLVACGPTAQGDMVLTEFAIDGPTSLADGSTDLTVRNDGEFGHTVVVTDDAGEVVASTDVIAPGTSVPFTVDLVPGEYQVSCRIVVQLEDGTLVDHFEQGMFAPLTVAG